MEGENKYFKYKFDSTRGKLNGRVLANNIEEATIRLFERFPTETGSRGYWILEGNETQIIDW